MTDMQEDSGILRSQAMAARAHEVATQLRQDARQRQLRLQDQLAEEKRRARDAAAKLIQGALQTLAAKAQLVALKRDRAQRTAKCWEMLLGLLLLVAPTVMMLWVLRFKLYAADTPDAPTVYVKSSTNTNITVAWTPASDGGSPVSSWLVYGSKDGVNWPAASVPMYTVTTGSTHEQTISCIDVTKWDGSTVAKTYVYLKVAGVNKAGTGVQSNSYRWRCSAPPGTPAPVTKASGTASSVTLSCIPSDTNQAILIGYKIMYDDGMYGAFSSVMVTATSQTEYTVGGLTAGLPYRFQISIVSEVGESDPSPVSVLTPSAPFWQDVSKIICATIWTFLLGVAFYIFGN